MKLFFITNAMAVLLLSACSHVLSQNQQTKHYDLVQLLQDNKLVTTPDQQTQVLNDAGRKAISTRGIVWLKDVNFEQGTIEVDLRGKNIMLQSFLGVAFHGVDTTGYDVVYFRPFNFKHADTARRRWSVQYMAPPDFDYGKLRQEHPQVYENAVDPVPDPDNWFHAAIVVKGDWITVYVNHSPKPSLRTKKLNNVRSGKVGLWTSTSPGDFANLSITQ